MIYLTGDLHGDFLEFKRRRNLLRSIIKPEDYLIVLGDFQFVDFKEKGKEKHLDEMSRMKFTILFLDGNHDNHKILNSYPVTLWNGGNVHQIRKNIFHLMRGQVFVIDNQTIFVMGGGFSFNWYQLDENVDWWPFVEMPNESDYENARINLKKHGNNVDYIITHTAPYNILSAFGFYHSKVRCDEINRKYNRRYNKLVLKRIFEGEEKLNKFIQETRDIVCHQRHYFAHLHTDEDLLDRQYCVYKKVRRITDGIHV